MSFICFDRFQNQSIFQGIAVIQILGSQFQSLKSDIVAIVMGQILPSKNIKKYF